MDLLRKLRRPATPALAFWILGTVALASTAAPAPSIGEATPGRVLVAPVTSAPPPDSNTPSDQAIDQVARSLPALIAEALSADRGLTASLAHDLSPRTLESLGLAPDPASAISSIPDAATLATPESSKALLADGSIRIV